MRSAYIRMVVLLGLSAIAMSNLYRAETAQDLAGRAVDLLEKVGKQRDDWHGVANTWREVAGKVADGRLVRPPAEALSKYAPGACCRIGSGDSCEIDVLLSDGTASPGSTVWCDASKAAQTWATGIDIDWHDWRPTQLMIADCDGHEMMLDGKTAPREVTISWDADRRCVNVAQASK